MTDNIPQHVAIIPDGNRRWAKQRGLLALYGHNLGAEMMHLTVEHLIARGIKYLTVWGFSTDNWKRADNEVNNLFHVLAAWIEEDTLWLNSRGVRLRHIGRFRELPQDLQASINKAIELTSDNTGMTLILAFNYTGRAEIVDAVRRLIDAGIPSHWIPPREIDEKFFSRYLYTDGIPDVDLVIRTAGEFRLSNFMLWQTAYSEYYFTEVLWPDFGIEELEKALKAYSERKRRFGGD
ncbi:Isoprenyl transferase [subsurface metagenome]